MSHPIEDLTAVAVPLWVERCKGVPFPELQRRAQVYCDELGEHGDDLLFRAKKPGRTAELFNRYAEAVAILSFVPGGVTVFGHHFESFHPDLPGVDDKGRPLSPDALRERAARDFGGVSGLRNWLDSSTEAFKKRTR